MNENNFEEKINEIERRINDLESRIEEVIEKRKELPPHFHKVDRIRMIDLDGGFKTINSTPSHPEVEGKMMIYSNGGRRSIFVKIDKGWHYVDLT